MSKRMSRERMIQAHLAQIARNQQVTDKAATSMMVELWSAFEALKNGSNEPLHMATLAGSLNTAMVLAEDIDPEVVAVIDAAHDAVRECLEIQERHGKPGFSGPGMLAVSEALETYDQIVRLQTPQGIYAAAQKAHKRVMKASR